MSVLIESTLGNLVIDLEYDKEPLLSFNFLKLCKAQYFYFAPFFQLHRDMVVYCGDPDYPEGSGGSAVCSYGSFVLNGEVYEKSKFLKVGQNRNKLHTNGSKGNDLNVGKVYFALQRDGADDICEIGSQFFISLSENEDVKSFPGMSFGRVAEGFSVLQKINSSIVDPSDSRFLNDIRITHVHILHDPFDDPEFMKHIDPVSDPTELQVKHLRLSELAEYEEDNEKQKADIQAISLELMGDLPHSDIKPSPRTLFIAKLNPITNSESLEIFFSRFGPVRQASVLIDSKTNKSKCYGFVEFETQECAEKAYMKLRHGCTIDGRGIYVDFSQSVSRRK